MATSTEIRANIRAQDRIIKSASRDLNRLWGMINAYEIQQVKDLLTEVFPILTTEYGNATAVLSAEWFEADMGLPATLAPTVAETEAVSGALSVLDPIFRGSPSLALSRVTSVMDRMIRQPGRDTIIESALGAGIGFARVPNSGACGFCLVLGSQGVHYSTRASAGEGKINAFHDNCKCSIIAVRDERDYPRGYDPEALRDMYFKASKAAGSSDMSKVLHEMRIQQGVR